jgi:trimethylamine--corrinoid protein Co-methyltransferase
VPPGGHFLGTAHTLANFETANHPSTLPDTNSFEQWSGVHARRLVPTPSDIHPAGTRVPPMTDRVRTSHFLGRPSPWESTP